MSMELGAAFRPKPVDYGPISDLIAGMRANITADLRQQILDDMASMLSDAVARIVVQAPSVTVPVTVETPGEDDAGEILAMQANTEVLKVISNQLGSLLMLLAQPVVKTVDRGADELIEKVTERRG